MVIGVLPASLMIYFSRLLTLQAFLMLKKHQGGRKGVAYNRCIQQLDKLFFLSRLRKLNYIEFLLFRTKNRSTREKWGDTAAITIICVLLFIQFYFNEISAFIVEPIYLIFIMSLVF